MRKRKINCLCEVKEQEQGIATLTDCDKATTHIIVTPCEAYFSCCDYHFYSFSSFQSLDACREVKEGRAQWV